MTKPLKKDLLLKYAVHKFPNVGRVFTCRELSRGVDKIHPSFKNWDVGTVSGYLGRMVKAGVVEIVPGSSPYAYVLTPSGRKLAASIPTWPEIESSDQSIQVVVGSDTTSTSNQLSADTELDYHQIGEGVVSFINDLKRQLEGKPTDDAVLADLENEVHEVTGKLKHQQAENRQLNNMLAEKDAEISRLTKVIETLNTRISNGIVEANHRDATRQWHQSDKIRLGDVARIRTLK